MAGVSLCVVPLLFRRTLLDEGQDAYQPCCFVATAAYLRRIAWSRLITARGISAERAIKQLGCQADLMEVVDTLRPAGRLPRLLDCWQQQGYQNANDRDYDQ